MCKQVLTVFGLVLLCAGAALGQMSMPMGSSGDPVPPEQLPAPERIAGVGNVRFPISANAEAQMWFEQGMNLLYDFWDYEADRAFEQAIRVDPNCAMCYWGLYQGETFRHSGTKKYSQQALDKAVALADHVTRREKLYIQATQADAAAVKEAGPDGKPNFDKEVEILRTLVKENPTDTNAQMALAEALGDGYDDKGEPRKGTKEKIEIIQAVLKAEPDNSAANHFWIHAVEASPHPEQALHSAQILGSLAPASGHMVHMPGHIFYRTGDYDTAQTAFDASAVTDETYMRQQKIAVDNDWNYVHNLMYSIANLLEAGRMQQAAQVSAKLGPARGHLSETLYTFSPRDSISRLNLELPIALRTGDWARVLNYANTTNLQPGLPNLEFLAASLAQFAHGMQSVEAHEPDVAEKYSLLLDAGLWRMSQQVKAQADADKAADKKDEDQPESADADAEPLVDMLSIMSLELRASMMAASGKVPEAQKLFAQAGKQEKDAGYREPPFYIRPVAEAEAAAMMTAGQWKDAQAALQKALVDRPNSGFALYGIAVATEKQGDAAATATAYRHFLSSWKTADADLPQIQHAHEWLAQHPASATPGT
jgi:tetratricopeptide (TPR) repeat protein